MELVRGDWRTYTQDLSNPLIPPKSDGQIVVSSVNIEENGQRQPVNYVLLRVSAVCSIQSASVASTERAGIVYEDNGFISCGCTDAVYKSTAYDLRRYKRLQMFAHAEAPIDESKTLSNGDFSVFIRFRF